MFSKLKSLNSIASPLEWEKITEEDVLNFIKKDPSTIRRKDETGAFPLHNSIISGAKLEVVKLIYNFYPDAIYEKSEGYLPIHFAADDPKRHYLVLSLAKFYTESLIIKDDKNRSPVDMVINEKNLNLSQKLYKLYYDFMNKKN
jgi:hypothetical protein